MDNTATEESMSYRHDSDISETQLARIVSKCVRVGDCVEYQGRKSHFGYGVIVHRGKTIYLHRLSYELAYGAIPDGMLVCHKCDNPPCLNPEHLFLGTHKDNAKDRNKKRRHAFGERHGRAKLTDEQAAAIRRDFRRRDVIAREYGITEKTVYMIRSGQRRASARASIRSET